MNQYKRLIGTKIKARRRAIGLNSQRELAQALKTDVSRISRWESGQSRPAARYRKRLAKILKINETELFDISESPPSELFLQIEKLSPPHKRFVLALIESAITQLNILSKR